MFTYVVFTAHGVFIALPEVPSFRFSGTPEELISILIYNSQIDMFNNVRFLVEAY